MSKKNKKEILGEALSRFNMLNEYSFYVPEGDEPEGDVDDLLLAEDDPEGDVDIDKEVDVDIDGLGDELGVDPEAGQIVRHLLRPHVRRQKVHENRDLAAGDSRGL